MNTESSATKAAEAFASGEVVSVKPIGNGLINTSFLVTEKGAKALLLQRINTTVFKQPEELQENYEAISTALLQKNFFLPAMMKTKQKELLWKNGNEAWRAFEYIPDSYSPDTAKDTKEAATVADCFGRFTAALNDFPASNLKIIIPRFHDLSFRFQQFEDALQTTVLPFDEELKEASWQLLERKPLVDVYNRFADKTLFPLHVMHHDCKVNNLLFDRTTAKVICPIDLDTVMPGKFFSDLGDMIRTLCCTVDENSTAWERIGIKEDYYETVTEAYLASAPQAFTAAEKQHIHQSGLLLTYMQALRFFTDYLNGNVYYKVRYGEQNFHRAKNQLLLLKSLEDFLKRTGRYSPS